MKTLTLNGWGQVYDSLNVVSPGKPENIDYSEYPNFHEFADNFKSRKVDVVIGWSLGGQVALRLIEKGLLKTKLLVLMATPYQFVADKDFLDAMPPYLFKAFKDGFAMLPSATLHRFALMIAHNDSNMKNVISDLGIDKHNQHNWLGWLGEIGKYSCSELDFKKISKTLILHGREDTIVNVRQAVILNEMIRNSRLEIFDNCGHAPHFHDLEKVKRLIREAIDG